jgi:putative salt-induced outer membrane protein YdiY
MKTNKAIIAGMMMAVVLAAVPLATAAEAEWDSTVALGVNITSGNSETLALNGSVAAERDGDVHEIRLGVEGNFGEAEVDGETETTTENAKALAAYKYKLNGTYLYSDNSILHDEIAAVDYRLVIGVGVGYHVIDSENAKLGLELGVAYLKEELADDTQDDNMSARVAARHDQSLSKHAKFWLAAEYLPNTDDTDDYLLNGEAGAEAALNSTLSLRVVLQDRYDSVVPAGREENDLSVISALVYTL